MRGNRRTTGEYKAGFPGTGGDVTPKGDEDELDVEGHGGPQESLHRRPPLSGGTGEGAVPTDRGSLKPTDTNDADGI